MERLILRFFGFLHRPDTEMRSHAPGNVNPSRLNGVIEHQGASIKGINAVVRQWVLRIHQMIRFINDKRIGKIGLGFTLPD